MNRENTHHTKSKKAITRHLANIGERHLWQVYQDWMAAMVAAYVKDEDAYMKVVNSYTQTAERGKRPADHMAAAHAELLLAMQGCNNMGIPVPDYLGDMYEEALLSNKARGQFFTPQSLANLSVEITMPKLEEGQSVIDPACGSGRMLIASIRKNPKAIFYGVDVDVNCVNMAALNMIFRNVDGYVIHANTLSLDTYGGYQLKRTLCGGVMRQMDKDEAYSLLITYDRQAEQAKHEFEAARFAREMKERDVKEAYYKAQSDVNAAQKAAADYEIAQNRFMEIESAYGTEQEMAQAADMFERQTFVNTREVTVQQIDENYREGMISGEEYRTLLTLKGEVEKVREWEEAQKDLGWQK